MSFFNDFEDEILDAMLGDNYSNNTIFGATIKIGLSTTTPTEAAGSITEPIGGSYDKVTLTNDTATFGDASSGEKSNDVIIAFPTATGDWGTITHWVLYDNATPALWGLLDDGAGTPTPRTVLSGDDFVFAAGQLRITLD